MSLTPARSAAWSKRTAPKPQAMTLLDVAARHSEQTQHHQGGGRVSRCCRLGWHQFLAMWRAGFQHRKANSQQPTLSTDCSSVVETCETACFSTRIQSTFLSFWATPRRYTSSATRYSLLLCLGCSKHSIHAALLVWALFWRVYCVWTRTSRTFNRVPSLPCSPASAAVPELYHLSPYPWRTAPYCVANGGWCGRVWLQVVKGLQGRQKRPPATFCASLAVTLTALSHLYCWVTISSLAPLHLHVCRVHHTTASATSTSWGPTRGLIVCSLLTTE